MQKRAHIKKQKKLKTRKVSISDFHFGQSNPGRQLYFDGKKLLSNDHQHMQKVSIASHVDGATWRRFGAWR
jgi:hypothetical protein